MAHFQISISYNFVVIFSCTLFVRHERVSCLVFSGFTSGPAALIAVRKNRPQKLFEPLFNRRLLAVQYLVYTLNTKIRMDFAASETNDIKATETPDKMCRTIECSSCISNLYEYAV